MISIEKIKAYIKCPQFGDLEYGKWWETLGLEERVAYRKLIEEIDSADEVIKEQSFEIERLNNIINELEKTLLEWHEYWENDDNYSWQYKNAYDYLQELKGDSSNE